jgi:hypothetical protein
MKILRLSHYVIAIVFVGVTATSGFSQQGPPTEKQVLVTKFRQLTGADKVNLRINVSFEDIRNDLLETVDGDKDLTDAQKQVLRKSAIEAYDRLDNQLKAFLNDTATINPLSEGAVFRVYDQTFNETELKDLIAFYSTPTGEKALRFLPTLSAQVQEAFQAMLLPKIQDFIAPRIKAESEQLKQKIQEAKTKTR